MSREKFERALYLSKESAYRRKHGPVRNEPGTAWKHPGYYVDSPRHQVFEAMGVRYKSRTIPKNAEGVAIVDGITFKLKKHTAKGVVERKWTRRGSGLIKVSTHRLFAECPLCGKEVPVGRMQQHAVVHDESRPARKSRSTKTRSSR